MRFRFLRPHALRLSLFAGLIVATGLIEAAFIIALTRGALAATDGLDTVTVTRNVVLSIPVLVLVCVIGLVLRFALQYVAVRIQSGLQYRVVGGIRLEIIQRLLAAKWRTQEEQSSGKIQQLLTGFPSQIMNMVYLMTAGLGGVLSLIALLGVSFLIDPIASLTIVAVLAAIIGGLAPLRRLVRSRSASSVQTQMRFADRVSELSAIKEEIAVLRLTDVFEKRLRHEVLEDAGRSHKVQLSSGLVTPLYTTFAYGAVLAGLWILGSVGSGDVEGIGSVMMIMLRSLTYGQQAQQLPMALSQFGPFSDQIARTLEELELERRKTGEEAVGAFKQLSLRSVSFGFSPDVPVLESVNLEAQPGEVLGIVGQSGSGKSTLVKVALGLYKPDSGDVLINGLALESISDESWHRIIGFVPQDPKLISGTVAENVRFFRSHISDDAIEESLDLAGLQLSPDLFPLGLETPLGDGIRSLSGGQRQRLVIARALVHGPELLVLDEPTAALDEEAERVIVETIDKLRGRTAMIVITHREETLQACTHAFTLDRGRLLPRDL